MLREQRIRPPVVPARPLGMSALGEQVVILASTSRRLPDQLLAVEVALRSVDHVEPGVERVVEQAGDHVGRRPLVTDLRAAKAEHADLHVGLAEPSRFHESPPPTGWVMEAILSPDPASGYPPGIVRIWWVPPADPSRGKGTLKNNP